MGPWIPPPPIAELSPCGSSTVILLIPPDSGVDDSIIWTNLLPTSPLRTDFVGWLLPLQKMLPDYSKTVRSIEKLQWRESCRPACKSLKLLTLLFLSWRFWRRLSFFKLNSMRFRIHLYGTRGRDNYWTGRHRMIAHERLSSQAGVHI